MPRYFFHIIRDGRRIEDEEGLEFPDIDAVKAEAFASARELAIESLKQCSSFDGDRIEVRDENGHRVVAIPVRAVIS